MKPQKVGRVRRARDRPLQQLALPDDLGRLVFRVPAGMLAHRRDPLRGRLPAERQPLQPPHPARRLSPARSRSAPGRRSSAEPREPPRYLELKRNCAGRGGIVTDPPMPARLAEPWVRPVYLRPLSPNGRAVRSPRSLEESPWGRDARDGRPARRVRRDQGARERYEPGIERVGTIWKRAFTPFGVACSGGARRGGALGRVGARRLGGLGRALAGGRARRARAGGCIGARGSRPRRWWSVGH